MEIIIDGNDMKVLGHHFFHLHNIRQGQVKPGGYYKCRSKKYGDLGTVLCEVAYSSALFEVKATPCFLHMGKFNFRELMPALATAQGDTVQSCVFRFSQRNSQAFQRMILKETSAIGIELTFQPNLFQI